MLRRICQVSFRFRSTMYKRASSFLEGSEGFFCRNGRKSNGYFDSAGDLNLLEIFTHDPAVLTQPTILGHKVIYFHRAHLRYDFIGIVRAGSLYGF